LPTEVLDWDIDGILDAGVQSFPNHRLGEGIAVDSLIRDGFDAVFVAVGGWDAQMSHPMGGNYGPALPGIRFLVDVVLEQRSGGSPSLGKHILILGGGSASLEAASRLIRDGAQSVHVVSRTSREDFPASEPELLDVEERGVQLHFNSGLMKMIGKGPSLTHADIVRISPEGAAQGESARIPADCILIGAGRFPELIYAPGKDEESEDKESPQGPVWETVLPYPSPFAEEDVGIFRPGEATGDYKAVVEAIGSGRRAAASIHLYLSGNAVEPPQNMIRRHTRVLGLDRLEPLATAPRQKMHQRSREELITDPQLEVDLGFSEDQALEEAARCLQCGLICYRRVEGESH
jgi:NADPH-dependent glutamate synthase beta subunit-like oxidoreductase